MTLGKMISDAMTFIYITICYMLIMVATFQTLYGEGYIGYAGFIATIRTLFDAMLGNYSYYLDDYYEYSHSLLLMLHFNFKCVFAELFDRHLVNYL